MPRLLPLYLAICAASLAPAASAQQVLTESDAVGRLSLESPRARAVRAEVELARADALSASRFPNPRVTASREAVAGVSEGYLLLSQALPVTGRRGLQTESAGELVRASQARADDLLRRLRADIRRAFVDLSFEESRERELESALVSLQGLADVLAKRERAGDAAGFDRLRAEREALDLAASLGECRARRARAQGALATFFFPSPDPTSLHAAPLAGGQPPLPAAEDLITRAGTGRPDLQALERDIAAARLAGRAAARSVVPEPEVVAGLKTSSAGEDQYGSVFSVVASIPLFDRARPEKAQAAARELLATAERDALRAEMTSTVRGLHAAAEQRRRVADSYRKEAIPRSDELRRIAQISYDAGERGILELLDAYRSAADARLRLADLDAVSAYADIDLELATAVEIRK
jgi:cobalt-zinc-cadmium efflux system outer membrane protein